MKRRRPPDLVRSFDNEQRLPVHMHKYVIVTTETAKAIELHLELVWEAGGKLSDALAPCGGRHVDHRSALIAINDMLIALRYAGSLVQRSMADGIFTDGD